MRAGAILNQFLIDLCIKRRIVDRKTATAFL